MDFTALTEKDILWIQKKVPLSFDTKITNIILLSDTKENNDDIEKGTLLLQNPEKYNYVTKYIGETIETFLDREKDLEIFGHKTVGEKTPEILKIKTANAFIPAFKGSGIWITNSIVGFLGARITQESGPYNLDLTLYGSFANKVERFRKTFLMNSFVNYLYPDLSLNNYHTKMYKSRGNYLAVDAHDAEKLAFDSSTGFREYSCVPAPLIPSYEQLKKNYSRQNTELKKSSK